MVPAQLADRDMTDDTPTEPMDVAEFLAVERASVEFMRAIEAGVQPPDWDRLVEKHRRAIVTGRDR